MFFVELALIRWTAANNVYLAYITNFVLLASFLGIGAGFLLVRWQRDLFAWMPVALALLVAFELAFPVRLVALKGMQFQGALGMSPLPDQVSLPIIFALVVMVMVTIGQAIGKTFAALRPLEAYRLDLLGSIGGIALFSLMSFLQWPPISWGALAVLAYLALSGLRQRWWQWGALAALVVMLVLESLSPIDTWSPYYKVTAVRTPGTHHELKLWANNIPHQTLFTLSTLRRIERFYFFPYQHVDRARLHNVLVVGAGTGNDVGIALSQGARHVDAVEIDPVLIHLGRQYNPEHAYQSRRVTVHIGDGRAYLEDTTRKYNLILFALPDSLTALAGQAGLRLEDYLFTTEAMQVARAHLAPGGVFAMYNYYQPWLLDRYATTLRDVYGSRPCVQLGNALAGRRQAVLTIARDGRTPDCATLWHGKAVAPVTDNRPFPYIPTPSIPLFYVWVILLILAGSALVVRVAGGPLGTMTRYADLACMGAAFMLLESKNVVQFALLFGTTWFVNSLVFAGVLLSVYAAVEVARHARLPRPSVLYGALGVTLAVAWVVPQESLLGLPVVPRFLAATALAFAPIFLANLVFAQRFRNVSASTVAFGANLLGAIGGGVLEYLSLVTGYRFLLVLVAVLYGLAFVFGRRHLVART